MDSKAPKTHFAPFAQPGRFGNRVLECSGGRSVSIAFASSVLDDVTCGRCRAKAIREATKAAV